MESSTVPSPTGSFKRQSVVMPPSASAWATIMWMLLDPTSIAARRNDSRLSCLWDKRDVAAARVIVKEYTIKAEPE